MKDLNKHVVPLVTSKWYNLGLELLDPAKHERILESIEENSSHDIEHCCRKMLSKWLETSKEASWDQLIEAVRAIKE